MRFSPVSGWHQRFAGKGFFRSIFDAPFALVGISYGERGSFVKGEVWGEYRWRTGDAEYFRRGARRYGSAGVNAGHIRFLNCLHSFASMVL